MSTNVPTPPDAEAGRQQTVHALRAGRVKWARVLIQSDFTDRKAASLLTEINAQIDILKFLRSPIDTSPEPSIEDIIERGLNWYWEDWSDMTEESDESR
jgi:hypothetical protein